MVRRFAIGSPADLMALDAMKKSGACVSVAKVWGAAKNRGGGVLTDGYLWRFTRITGRRGARWFSASALMMRCTSLRNSNTTPR